MKAHLIDLPRKYFVGKIVVSTFLVVCVASFFACPSTTPPTEHTHVHDSGVADAAHHHDEKGTDVAHQHDEKGTDATHHADTHHADTHHADTPHSTDTHHTETAGDTHKTEMPGPHTYLFNDDKANNKWVIQIFHPTKGLVKTLEVPELAARTAKKAKDTSTDDVGPAWGDALASHDHKRIFVDATNADALVVIDTVKMEVEKIVEFNFGDRPLHNYLPNHGTEAWIHLDGKGAFYVIDTQTLQPIRDVDNLASCTTVGTGHGKLAYSKELGTKYFCTNTSEPAGFALDGKEKKILKKFEICGVPPVDDPKTPEDESKGPLKGGTHDKAYLPGINLIVFECTGGAGYTFVNPDTLEVVKDKVAMSGGMAYSPNNEYVLSINAGAKEKQIQVWDKSDTQKNEHEFDYTFDVDGSPSARGTHFRKEGDAWQAWIPQSAGTKVAVINLSTKKIDLVEVGKLTPPAGAGHFSRRGAAAKEAFYTVSDEGLVKIDYATLTMSKVTGALQGTVSRFAFVDPHAHE